MRRQTSPKAELFARAPRTILLGVFGVFACALTVLAVTPLAAVAATNSTVNFQARLETASGAIAPDGNYNVEFKLYNASTSSGSSQGSCTGDAHCLWVETRTGGNQVRVANGYLSVGLGSVNAFSGNINWNQQLWVTMNIGGTGASPSWDGEMNPRLQLTAVPYAFQAGTLSSTDSSGHIGTLSFPTSLTNSTDAITLPDASGTVCLQGSSSCGFATGSGSAFLQGGNSFSAQAVLGTNDSNSLALRTSGTNRLVIDTSGNVQLQQASTFNVASAATGINLTIQGGAATSGTNVGGNLILQGGAGASTGASGSVIVKSNTNNSTTAFQIQNASGSALLTSDTSNMQVTVSQGNLDVVGLGVVTGVSVAGGSNSSGTLDGGNTYYYQVSAVMPGGETIPSAETSIGGRGATNFTPITPPAAPSLALTTGSNLGVGTYKYVVTFETPSGETTAGAEASITTTSGNQAVNLTSLPIGPADTEWRVIYRTTVGGASGTERELAFIMDNTTTTYTDTTADSGLYSNRLPSQNTATTNTNTALVTWTAVPGATSYKIYRATSSGGENVYFTSATNSFTDTGSGGTNGSGVTSDSTERVGIGTISPRSSLDVLGGAIVQTPVNSTSAFQVQNAGGSSVLNVDTVNGTLTVNPSSTYSYTSSNLVSTNFSSGWTTTGWTVLGGGSSVQHNSGNTSSLVYPGTGVVARMRYEVDVAFSGSCGGTGDTAQIELGSTTMGTYSVSNCGSTETYYGNSFNTNDLTIVPTSGWTGTLTSISVYEITSTVTPAFVVPDALEIRATSAAGDSSVFVGLDSGKYDKGWNDNAALGTDALANNVNGSYNAALGNEALMHNTSGGDNVAVGSSALWLNQSGSSNTAVGSWTLDSLQAGDGNVALGWDALDVISSGTDNMALGYRAGDADFNGSFSTLSALQNATAIGAYAQVQSSNSIVLGSVDNATKVGIGITVPTNTFSVSPLDYQTGTVTRTNGSATLTGTGTTWTSAMVGDTIVFADGTTNTVSTFTSATSITMASTYTGTTDASPVSYRFHHVGLQVTSGGYLGVNTVNPTVPFEVNGNAKIDSNLYVGGTTYSILSNGQANLYSLTLNRGYGWGDYVHPDLYGGSGGLVLGGVASGGGTIALNTSSSSTTPTVYLTGSSVGIDNTNPQYSLDVSGTGRVKTSANSPTAFQVQNSGGANILDVDTSNNRVGIGITVPTNTLSVSPTDYSTGTVTRANGSATLVGTGTTWTSAMVGDTIVFADGTTNTVSAFTDATHITMGTTYTGTTDASPVGYVFNHTGLQVTSAGNAYVGVDSSSVAGFSVGSGSNVTNFLGVSGGRAMFGYDGGSNAILNAGTSKGFQLKVNGTSGTFSSGSAVLTVSSSGAATFQNASNSANAFQVQSTGGADALDIDTSNSRVGIGITVPTNTFSVSPLDYQTGTVTRTNGSATLTGTGTTWTSAMVGDTIVFADGTTNTVSTFTSATSITMASTYTGTTDASPVSYRFHHVGLQVTSTGTVYAQGNSTTQFQVQNAGGTSVLSVDTTNGRVGIGTASPNYTLDVSGTINATGNITSNGGNVVYVDQNSTLTGGKMVMGSNSQSWSAGNSGKTISFPAGVSFTSSSSFYCWVSLVSTTNEGSPYTAYCSPASGSSIAVIIYNGSGSSQTVNLRYFAVGN